MDHHQDITLTPANDDLLQHMFMQFLQTQASVQATRPSITKSKHTPDPEVFSGERPSTKVIHERLESFGIALNLKMTLNLNRMPTPEAHIAYTFSRTSGTAQGYIAPKIQAKLYQDWTNVLQDLKNAFSDLDPMFHTKCKLIKLCQANRTFAEFFTKFNKYARCLNFNDKALKCHLRCALSKELSRRLVSINLKDLSYQQLVQQCQTQDNQLRAASLNVCKTSSRFQPSVKLAKTLSPAINLPDPSKPTTPDANAMDLTHSKLTLQEKKRRCTLRLCFYCDLEGHTTFTCPLKPTKAHVRTIQEAPATQPTSEPTQDQGKE